MTLNARTIAFAMVKNEVDIIEPFVRHNIQHVDALIVFDHYSSDGTRDVLLKLSREYENVAVETYDENAQDQGELLSKQLARFQQRFCADYAVFLDADEFIGFDIGSNLASCVRDISPGGVGLVPWRTFVPDPDPQVSVNEPLDLFSLRRSQELPMRYKAILRLDGKAEVRYRIMQGSHSIRTQFGRKIRGKVLAGIHLMHFPVRSIDQLVAKSKIGSLTNSLRSNRKAKIQATQWYRVADMHRSGHIDEGNKFLFEEAMVYAQAHNDGNLSDNAEPADHGISTHRRYSNGQRLSAEALYQTEVARIQFQSVRGERWFKKNWFSRNTPAEKSDFSAVKYLVRKYGRSGLFFDLEFAGLSGFSTAAQDDCAVRVRLIDEAPGEDWQKMQFDTLVAQALSVSRILRAGLQVFTRKGN